MIEQFKQVLQDFLAPKLEAINGEIKSLQAQVAALDTKFEAKFTLLQGMIEGTRREFQGEIRRIEDKFTAQIHANSAEIRVVAAEVRSVNDTLSAEIRRVEETLSADFVRLEEKVDGRLAAMNEKLEFTRRELLAEIKAADKGATDKAA